MKFKTIMAFVAGIAGGVFACLGVLHAIEEKVTMSWGFAFDLIVVDSTTNEEIPITVRAESRSIAEPFLEKVAIVPKEGEKVRVYGSYQNRMVFEVTSEGHSTAEIELERSLGKKEYTMALTKLEPQKSNQAGDDNSE